MKEMASDVGTEAHYTICFYSGVMYPLCQDEMALPFAFYVPLLIIILVAYKELFGS